MSENIYEREHVVGARKEDVAKIKAIESPARKFETATALLSSSHAGELLSERKKIIFMNKNESVLEAWKTLIDNKILSLPIYDPKKSIYVGFIDIIDIVNIIVRNHTEHEIMNTTEVDIPNLLRSRISVSSLTVDEVGGRKDSFCPVEIRMPLREAIKLMIEWRTHRLPVVDGTGELVTILSQSRVLSYLAQHIELFPYTSSRICDLEGLITRNVLSVKTTDKAIDAFKLIQEKGINGVAVVDENSKLKGNISASDLRMIGYTMRVILRLFLPVQEFMELIPPNSTFASELICVNEKTTFEELLTKFEIAKIHRVYVVSDQDDSLTGVITLTDVLRYVLDHA